MVPAGLNKVFPAWRPNCCPKGKQAFGSSTWKKHDTSLGNFKENIFICWSSHWLCSFFKKTTNSTSITSLSLDQKWFYSPASLSAPHWSLLEVEDTFSSTKPVMGFRHLLATAPAPLRQFWCGGRAMWRVWGCHSLRGQEQLHSIAIRALSLYISLSPGSPYPFFYFLPDFCVEF